MNFLKKVILIVALFLMPIYLMNASWLVTPTHQTVEVLAHRGLHQTYNPMGVDAQTCTAKIVDKPAHNYLENTVDSMQAAFDLGADIVELDIHPTLDGEFVVFHDWELSCRTNGQGVVRDQNLDYLKSLDIGYGYTHDGGSSYPFRGKFFGAMPTLDEVISMFKAKKLLINIKSNDMQEAELLTNYLEKYNQETRKNITVYGSGNNIPYFSELNADIKTFSKQGVKACLKHYAISGWLAYMPKACHNTYVMLPKNIAPWMWGWPNRLEARLAAVNSKIILLGDHQKNKANSGIDYLDEIPKNFNGIIFTNRIDNLAR